MRLSKSPADVRDRQEERQAKACPILEFLEDLWIGESSTRARDIGNKRENEMRFDRVKEVQNRNVFGV